MAPSYLNGSSADYDHYAVESVHEWRVSRTITAMSTVFTQSMVGTVEQLMA
jgi:hypothetical protein